MAEIRTAEFQQQFQGLSDFLSNKSKVAFTDNHKFIYGQGKEMKHTELLKKFESLANSLSEKNATLPARTKEQISSVISEMYQITNAKLDKTVSSTKSDKVLQARMKSIENLAQKLGISLQVPKSKDSNVIMKRDWYESQNPGSADSPLRKFTLQRFADAKMQFISEEKESISKINLTQRASDASRVSASLSGSSSSKSSSTSSLSSLGSTSTNSLGQFSVESLEVLNEHLNSNLSASDKETLINQLHQNFFNKAVSKPDELKSFQSQLADLSDAFDVKKGGSKEDAATEILSKLIFNKSSPTTLFTSLNVIARDVKFPNNKESYLKATAEILREGGKPSIALRLQGTIPSEFASQNKGFKKVDAEVSVDYNPISGQHTETLTLN